MKAGKLMLILVVTSMLLLTAGCTKTYYFNFTKEDDLARNDGTWSSYDDSYKHTVEGLFPYAAWVAVPHVYSGDLTATIKFELNTNSANSVPKVEFYLSAKNGWFESDGYAGIAIDDIGLASTNFDVYHANYSQGGLYYLQDQSPVPGLDPVGINTLVIEQKSGALSFWLNDEFLAAFNPTRYNVDLYCLNIYGMQDENKSCMFIKDVKIEYSGTRELISQ